MVLALGQHFIWLATLSTFVRLLTYALCIASLPFIERSVPEQAGQFRLPGRLLIPIAAFVFTLWLLGQSTGQHLLIAGLIVALGAIIFWFCTRSR